jgi:hypothetical protein
MYKVNNAREDESIITGPVGIAYFIYKRCIQIMRLMIASFDAFAKQFMICPGVRKTRSQVGGKTVVISTPVDVQAEYGLDPANESVGKEDLYKFESQITLQKMSKEQRKQVLAEAREKKAKFAGFSQIFLISND